MRTDSKKPKRQYTVTLTEEHLRVIQKACEEYFRLRLGQETDFCSDLASMEHDIYSEGPEHERIFNQYLVRRDSMQEIMKALFHIAFGFYGVPSKKTEDMLTAETIWDAIRFARGLSRWDKPFQAGKESIPKIKEFPIAATKLHFPESEP